MVMIKVYSKVYINTYRFRSRKYFLKVKDNFLESCTSAESTQAQEDASTYMTASEKNHQHILVNRI